MKRLAPSALAAALALVPVAAAQQGGFVWDAAAAEHLLNRAGFGARPAEIEAAVAMGREAFVEHLLTGGTGRGEPYYASDHMRGAGLSMLRMDEVDTQSKKELRRLRRVRDGRQLRDFAAYWIERMLSGEDPLREKLTLFWHSHFATSQRDVKNSFEMIRQNELLHEHALASFEDLVRSIARDPAMLEYLDNDDNRKEHPNENFARELMELFTLGEGNYTEEDVKEAARAFTGWTDGKSSFRFKENNHDEGEKVVLGVTGNLDGDDVIDILLDREACGLHVASKLITYFEGVEPDPDRAGFYGEFFAANDYDVELLLRRLFNDPAFYRDEVVGTRIAGPVDFVVGTARRLGIRAPARLLNACIGILGQKLFEPPSVKGWDEGEAWINTSSLMHRGNLAGMLIGAIAIDDILAAGDHEVAMEIGAGMMAPEKIEPPAESVSMSEASADSPEAADAAADEVAPQDGSMMAAAPPARPRPRLGDFRPLKDARAMEWEPRLNLTARIHRLGAEKDGEIVRALVDELFAIEIDADTRKYLREILAAERKAAGIKNGKLLGHPDESEPILRKLAHVALSLPEAQLH